MFASKNFKYAIKAPFFALFFCLNQNLGGNKLIYNESEDAYYIQNAGADTGLKKLGGKEVFIFRNVYPSSWVTYTTLRFSVADLYPEYNKLSIDNIFVQINMLFAITSGYMSPFTYSYDAATGTVSMIMNRIETSNAIGSSGYGTNADIIIIV